MHLIKNILIPLLNRVKDEFLKLGLGTLTNKYLNDILFDECQHIKNQVPESKITGLLKVCKELKRPTYLGFEIIKDFPSVDESGSVVLTNEATQSLREFHSIYALTESGVALFESHKAAAKALNQFFQLAKENNYPIDENLSKLFSVNGKGNIVPFPLEYDSWINLKNSFRRKN